MTMSASASLPLKAFVTTREAARLLGMSLRTVQLWAERGLLECWKTEGGHRRILRASVERLLHRRAPQQIETPPRAPPLRILVVEDEPTLLRLYRLQLARWPMRPVVRAAANGFEALLRIGKEPPDLLIADLNMPQMDGFDMLRTLRAMPELDSMEIIVVTGLDAEQVAQRGGLPQGIPSLCKPIDFPELERFAGRLAAQLGRQHAAEESGRAK